MVYFLSDMHLGASYVPDRKAAERRLVRFLDSIADDATDIYLMGDVLDYWYEYRTVVPRGYVRFLGKLAELADRGIKIHWFIGNHDIWLFDYLRDEIGMEVVDGYRVEEILGHRFFLSHGDGVGRLKPGFRLMRYLFRNRLCQWLYASVHPRWTIPFAHGWSRSNRAIKHYESPKFGPIDREPLAVFAKEYLRDVDPTIEYFVFGHRHAAVNENLSQNCRLIILGDWIWRSTYAKFDGKRLELCEFETENALFKKN